ncbi:MAG: SRPBCC family protein [Owenweeksia sp.]
MKTQPLVIERTLDAPIQTVWNALTRKEEMDKWYFKLDGFKPEEGFTFSFAGQGRKGEKYIHLCKVLEVNPPHKLRHSWTYQGLDGYTEVTFELFEEGEKTRVKLTHTGLESFKDNGADFTLESFTMGWTEIIGSMLRKFVEDKDQ